MNTITKAWFENRQIFILTNTGEIYSQPLEVFPSLLDATESQRNEFYIWDEGHSIRWPNIDEDIHISNFYEKAIVNYDNEVNTLLSKMPWLNLTEFANMLGMHKSKLDRFRYGIWTPKIGRAHV